MTERFFINGYSRKGLAGFSAVLFVFATSISSAQADPTYVTFKVQGKGTDVTAINSSGEVTGFYYQDSKPIESFLRNADGTITTFACSRKVDTQASSINDSGEITGFCENLTEGFVRASDGTMSLFRAAKDAAYTIPRGINAKGYIVGDVVEGGVWKGFLRNPDGKIETFPIPGMNGNTVGLNKKKQVVGVYTNAGGDYHGFLRDPDGTITTIDAPGAGPGTEPYGLNDKGWITGAFVDTQGQFQDFVRAPDGTFTEFNPCQPYPVPYGINNKQQVTGQCNQGFVRAADGNVQTFDIPAKPGRYVYPIAINDAGQIAGTAYKPDQHDRDVGFLRLLSEPSRK